MNVEGKGRPGEDPEQSCRICGGGWRRVVEAREMMLGLRDRFRYGECSACGSLQLLDPPADPGRYYAGGYYSFSEPYRTPRVRRWLKRRQARHRFERFDPMGALVAAVRGDARPLNWLARAGVGLDDAILDVGAGSGQLLIGLREYGFHRLLGIDPFLERDLEYPEGVRVLKAGLEDLTGSFDLIMFHHSFEHVPDPHETLARAQDRLADGGTILIRTPVVGRSWREYGADWVELDAPRHINVHSVRSVELLAERHGLRIDALEYDTEPFEILGSELYRRDIPLAEDAETAEGAEVFTADELRGFRERAEAMNRSGEAGRALFVLRPSVAGR